MDMIGTLYCGIGKPVSRTHRLTILTKVVVVVIVIWNDVLNRLQQVVDFLKKINASSSIKVNVSNT